MRKMGLQQTSEAFIREAGISNVAAGFNIHNSYLGEFWCDFWDALDDSPRTESSTQGAARGSARSQIRAHAQILAEFGAQAQAQTQIQTQTQAQAQIRALANDSYVHANIPRQPIADSTGNGGHGFQLGLGQEPSRPTDIGVKEGELTTEIQHDIALQGS
ncbi:hypothetical protein M8C21_020833 [Ambrosia artemisiifolia]|uniref:Uncharacterized protein n=1 Tax=Ambrosia artemisiifolia TaxID=4212 RepID=A0AAD5GC84_AMBAR|nr:hypothetical protein M8C21_020833 [Ambrosia artemisiifolia]